MLKFIARTAYLKGFVRQLHVACDTGYDKPLFNPETHEMRYTGACYYCMYFNPLMTYDEWITCINKHGCNESQYPFIKMMKPINDEVETEQPLPDGQFISYAPTGVFRQVKFEGQPLYVQLYVAKNGDGRCNASCWWHAWRLANKRTWRDCGNLHYCQNNSSLWVLMAPNNKYLYEDFITGNFTSIDAADFSNDFNNDFLI